MDLEQHIPLVETIARQYVGGVLEFNELVSEGILGTASAAASYDPDGGASFETYASHRIRGRVRDAIRKERGRGLSSRHPMECESLGERDIVGTTPSPDEKVMGAELDETCEHVREVVETLPDRERDVIVLSYFEGVLLKDIGKMFHRTESRMCQIRKKALETLRKRLKEVDV